MELILNLVGVLVALAIACVWLRWAPRGGSDRKIQLVALALLILILFPVISVTDDLQAAQNPAETDSCLRRDYIVAGAHAAPPLAAVAPEPLLIANRFGFLGFAAPDAQTPPVLRAAEMAPIDNRPPPAA